jgi:inhibitor of KinA
MKFIRYSNSALLIQFEQTIAPHINEKVIELNHAIEAASIDAIQYCIPAYCSLTVGYNPLVIDYADLCKKIKQLTLKYAHQKSDSSSRTLTIPVCYEEPFALDFKTLTAQTKLSKEAIIELHTSTPFQVYMLGFIPGFAYMGKLPESLFCTRKKNPRLKVPAGSVGLAGYQTGIYPISSPGGWQIIGKTPIPIFEPKKEAPFLFRAGDTIRFKSISSITFLEIKRQGISTTLS